MARRNRSFQDVFFESLDNAGRTALGVGQALREGERLEMDREMQPDRVRAGKAAADQGEAAAGKSKLDYEGLMREKSIRDQLDAETGKPADTQNMEAQYALWDRLNGLPAGSTKVKAQQAQSTASEADTKAKAAALDLDTQTKAQPFELENKRLGPKKARADIKESEARAAAHRADANRPPKASELPIDVRSEVQALSGKTAGKKAIANQLESDLIQLREAMGVDAQRTCFHRAATSTGLFLPRAPPDGPLRCAGPPRGSAGRAFCRAGSP
jgi:uncharacterized protein YbdZ (MbtH family)